jgi:hypothetical protein
MPNPNSTSRRKEFKNRELPIVTSIVNTYKQRKWKVVDNIESVMIYEPGTSFRIFVSRISHVLQMYYLGEGEVAKELSTRYLDSVDKVLEEEAKFKAEWG